MSKRYMPNNQMLQRVVTFLDREEVDLLDKIEKDALFSSRFHLPRTKIIKALVEVLKDSHIDGNNIRSLRELEDRLVNALKLTSENPP